MVCYAATTCVSFPKLGVPFWGGPHNKDYSILGFMMGTPTLENYHMCVVKAVQGTVSVVCTRLRKAHLEQSLL